MSSAGFRHWVLEASQKPLLKNGQFCFSEQELQTLKRNLDLIQQQIATRDHAHTSLEHLYRVAALVRTEIRKVCQTPDFSDPSLTEPPEARSCQAIPEPLPTAPDPTAHKANLPAGHNTSAAAIPTASVADLTGPPSDSIPQDEGSIQIID